MRPVLLQRIAGTPLAVVRRQVKQSDLPRVVPECCGLVWNALRAQGLRGGRHVALYWDGSIRLEAGVEVLGEFLERDGVVRSETPAGQVVSAAHFGAYSGLGDAHDALRKWCAVNDQVIAGPSWEVYGHWLPEWDRNPSLIRTDVFYQLVG